MYSLIPTSSASVELWTLIFCFDNFPWIIPYTIDMAPPVWLLVLSCTSYNASIQVNTSEKFRLVPAQYVHFDLILRYTAKIIPTL